MALYIDILLIDKLPCIFQVAVRSLDTKLMETVMNMNEIVEDLKFHHQHMLEYDDEDSDDEEYSDDEDEEENDTLVQFSIDKESGYCYEDDAKCTNEYHSDSGYEGDSSSDEDEPH